MITSGDVIVVVDLLHRAGFDAAAAFRLAQRRALVGRHGQPGRALVRGRARPRRMLHVNAFASWIETFGSATSGGSTLAASPVTSPCEPQWIGMPIWWTHCFGRS